MPTYEYECEACGHALELFQGIKDPPAKKCPRCEKLELRRLVGMGGGFIFKGSGFYITDYKKTGETKSDVKGKPDMKDKVESKANNFLGRARK